MMATAPYNQRPRTLADVLAGGINAPAYPVDIPQPPAPSGQDTIEGMLTPQQRSALLEQILNPPAEAAPPPEEKATFGKKFANTLADTFNNIATIYAGGPNLRSNYLEDYLNSVERRNAEKKLQARETAARAQAGQERRAGYLLSADERARAKADEAAGRKELKQMQIDQQKAQEAQDLAQQKSAQDFQRSMAQQQQAFEAGQQAARISHEEKVARLARKIADGDKEAQRQQEALGSAMAYVGASVDTIPQLLKGDPQNGVAPLTPEQVITKYRRAFDAMLKIGLHGDSRKAADDYFIQEAGPILKKYMEEQQNQALAAGSPQDTKTMIDYIQKFMFPNR